MLIDQKKPLAVITVCPLLQSMRHVIKDPDMQIPSATVSPQVGLEILRSLENPIHLKIVSNRQSGQSWNILGTRVGRQPERIVLSAHYDTVWGTQGAYDNASGVGVLLSLADALATVDLPFGLEFYASSGEEFGGQGTDVYQDQYGLRSFPFHFDQPIGEQSPIWKPILANLNTDGVGLALGKNNVTTIAASKAISEEIKLMCKNEFPGFDYVNPWPASDHYTFYSHGVPSVAFGCHPGMSTHHHQPVDTIQWLSADKLAEVVAFEFKIVQMIAAQPSDWTR
jgi:aminopeptidase YwaD